MHLLSFCNSVRIASHSGLERSRMTVLERPSATHSTFHFSFVISIPHLASRHYFCPPSRLDHRRKTNCEQITFRPTFTVSRFPFFFSCFSLPLYFRQRGSTLSRSCAAPVCSLDFP